MVSISIMGIRTGKGPIDPPLVTCGLPPSIRQRSVEVPPASSVTRSGKPAISAMTALPSAPAAMPAKIPRGFAHAHLIKRTQFVAAKIEPAAGLADELQWHDSIGLDPKIRIAVALRHRLPRDLEDMPETRVDDQTERIDLALQQCVGRNRGAVR